jgi:transposase
MRLFAGDDWAQDHHDVEVMDEAGGVLAKRRLPEGVAGIAQLHGLIGRCLGHDAEGAEVVVGIETDRGPWVTALIAAGYTVFPVNPLQASRYRERHGVSGAKSDGGDAHMLADMVRTDSRQLRPAAGDSAEAEGIKVLARTHKTLIWERTRQVQRLRHQLREYFPAALEAFEDLDAGDSLELLGKAPDPARAARLTRAQVSAALKRARRRNIPDRATAILAALRSGQLGQPAALTAAYSATARALIAVIVTLNEQVKGLQGQVEENFGRHPDAEIYRSQPGMGAILGARVLAEFGDDPAPVRRREGPEKLRGHQPHHPRVGQEEDRRRPVRPQRPARRCAEWPGLRVPERLARRPRPLRQPPRPRRRAQRRAPPPGQPARRHPARMPQDPHPLRRGHRLGPPAKPPSIFRSGLTPMNRRGERARLR